MFDWANMIGNYENRKVDCYEKGELFISTARVTDSTHPFETAVGHPDYNAGALIIVESYNSLDEAKAGHTKWIETMTAEDLPAVLNDVSGSSIAQFGVAMGLKSSFNKEKRKK